MHYNFGVVTRSHEVRQGGQPLQIFLISVTASLLDGVVLTLSSMLHFVVEHEENIKQTMKSSCLAFKTVKHKIAAHARATSAVCYCCYFLW